MGPWVPIPGCFTLLKSLVSERRANFSAMLAWTMFNTEERISVSVFVTMEVCGTVKGISKVTKDLPDRGSARCSSRRPRAALRSPARTLIDSQRHNSPRCVPWSGQHNLHAIFHDLWHGDVDGLLHGALLNPLLTHKKSSTRSLGSLQCNSHDASIRRTTRTLHDVSWRPRPFPPQTGRNSIRNR